jgi:hypothetical protein
VKRFKEEIHTLTTLIFNDMTNFFIVVDCTVIENNDAMWARIWVELGSLEQV